MREIIIGDKCGVDVEEEKRNKTNSIKAACEKLD